METELFLSLTGHVIGAVMDIKLAGDYLCFVSHLLSCSKIILLNLENIGRQESRNECQGDWALS